MKRIKVKSVVPVVKVLWADRKAEMALAAAVIALVREVVQAASGH